MWSEAHCKLANCKDSIINLLWCIILYWFDLYFWHRCKVKLYISDGVPSSDDEEDESECVSHTNTHTDTFCHQKQSPQKQTKRIFFLKKILYPNNTRGNLPNLMNFCACRLYTTESDGRKMKVKRNKRLNLICFKALQQNACAWNCESEGW